MLKTNKTKNDSFNLTLRHLVKLNRNRRRIIDADNTIYKNVVKIDNDIAINKDITGNE